MHSKSQMTKQNYEAFTVEAKMVTIEGRNLAWDYLEKESDWERAQDPRRSMKVTG